MLLFNAVVVFLSCIKAVNAAFTVADLTPCGLDCLVVTIPAAGCSLTDSACQCSSPKLAQASSLCLLQNCTMHDSLVVSKVQASICNLPNSNRSDTVIEVIASIAAFAAIFVALRLFTKWWLNNTIGIDDWIIGVDLLLVIPAVYFSITMTKEGFGKHIWNLMDGDLLRVLRNFYIAENIYVVVLGLVKVSILVFYLGIFPQTWFQGMTWGTIVLVGTSTATLSFLTIFQCKPVAYFWNRDLHGTCIDINALAYANSAMSIVQDILVVVLPIPVLMKLQLGRKKKLAVLFMFAVGSFGCIISMIRLKSLLSFGNSIDPTWDYTMTVIWTVAELGVAIMCACFPAIRSLLVRLNPKVFATSAQYSTESQSRSKPWYKSVSQQQRSADPGEFIELRNADTQENPRPPQIPSKGIVKEQHISVRSPEITAQHSFQRNQRFGPRPPVITAQHSWNHSDNR
ncbi:hypothetical protein ACMFMF_001432 [Clarireedia jacksonii]